MRRYVIYLRVSTQEQGRSGLGLEAQQRDIDLFLQNYSDVPFEIVGSFQDIGSGADNERPELAKAISLAKKAKAELLVAKLDRLSRRLSYVAALMEDPKLSLRVASMPNADKAMLHVYALVAEMERDFISVRTKSALASAKLRGVKLGGDRGGSLAKANAERRREAAERDARVAAMIVPMRANMTLQAIADHLNANRVAGPAGAWSPMSVKRVIDRGVNYGDGGA